MRLPALTLLFAVVLAPFVAADDWPQFRGPDRTGISKEKGLLLAWPKAGLKPAWVFKDAGLGFSSVAVVKGVVYTLGTDAKMSEEFIIALDEKTGKELWRHSIAPLYTYKGNTYGDGPRATPTVDGNLLYALSGDGQLVCVDITQKGKEVWRKHLVKDLGGVPMDKYGFSESPLVDGKHLICSPGGAKGTLVCLDKTNGNVIWQSAGFTHTAPFSSPIVAELHGVRQYIQASYDATLGKEWGAVSGFDAKTGKALWSGTIFKGTNDLNGIGMTPIVSGDIVYISSVIGGGHAFEIDNKQTAKAIYSKAASKKVRNAHGGMVLLDGHLYGHSERKRWVCQELKTGAIKWDENQIFPCDSGSLIAADGLLFLYSDEGEVGLAKADPKNFAIISSFALPEKSKIPQTRVTSRMARAWAHPALANGHLYVRDHEYLYAFKVAK